LQPNAPHYVIILHILEDVLSSWSQF